MNKILLVALREFRQRIHSRGFLIGSLAVPIFLVFIWYVVGDASINQQSSAEAEEAVTTESALSVLGYVDQADLIERIPAMIPERMLREYESADAANQAVENGEIAAYYLIPAGYRQRGEVQWVSRELPTIGPDRTLFNILLVSNLLADKEQSYVDRVYWPFNNGAPEFHGLVSQETGESGSSGFSILPFIVTMAIMMPLFTSGGYLLQSVAQEKSGRIMEILLVSLKPWHLLIGKLIGLGSLTLVQYVIWVVVGGAVAKLTGQDVGSILSSVSFSAEELRVLLPFALGGFFLYAGLMAGVGALSPNMEGSRSWVMVISLPMMIPIYLWSGIVGSPNGSLAVALSMIPFSSPVAMMMRMTSTAVPGWQLWLSLAVLIVTAVGMVWLMAKLFRVQTLLSGEALSVRRFAEALRS